MTLENVHIVLVGTTHPGNIGAAARAMKTMGLRHLVLADPLCEPDATALAMAANAGDVLRQARRVDSLATAVADCSLVVGTSARDRSVGWPSQSLREAARMIASRSLSGPVAIVFGREKSGLSNEELDHCNLLVRIPTATDAASLNLAAAVQVVCYELRQGATDPIPNVAPVDPGDDGPATAQELDHLFQHLETTILATGFLAEQRQGVVMRRLRSLILRAEPSHRDVRILRGILSSVESQTTPPAVTGDEEYV